jgi:NitT/TauT family transport system permease protein
MPKIAIAPLIVLWVGYGASGKIIISTIVCFFPIMLNTLHGLRIREIEHLELMQSLGASKLEMFRYIRLPGAVPFMFAGLHIGAVFALLGVVVGEFTGAQDGLGYFLLQQKAAFNVPGIFAILVVLMVLGVSIQAAMSGLERRISFWGRDQTHHERV